jgi:chemotaxis protein MotB
MIALSACVTTKKHLLVVSSKDSVNHVLQVLDRELTNSKEENKILKAELAYKAEKINDFDSRVVFLMKTNELLTEQIANLSSSTKVNANIMKRTIEELSLQSQKISLLSYNISKKDSLNVLLVKKIKRKMTDKKLSKSLEKLGFIFN